MFHKDTHFERINFLSRQSVTPITLSYPGNPCPSTEGFTNLLADTVSTLTTSTMLEILISFKDFYIHARCMSHQLARQLHKYLAIVTLKCLSQTPCFSEWLFPIKIYQQDRMCTDNAKMSIQIMFEYFFFVYSASLSRLFCLGKSLHTNHNKELLVRHKISASLQDV